MPGWALEVSKGRTGLRPQPLGRGEGPSSCSLSAGRLDSLPRVKPGFATVPPSPRIHLLEPRQPSSPCVWGLPGQDWDGAGFCPSQYLWARSCLRLREPKSQTPKGQKRPQESRRSTPRCSLLRGGPDCLFDPEAVSTLRLRQQLTAVRGGGRARPAGSVRWVETQWYRVWSFLSSLQGRSPSPLGERSREDRVGQGSRQSRSLVEGATWSLAEHV